MQHAGRLREDLADRGQRVAVLQLQRRVVEVEAGDQVAEHQVVRGEKWLPRVAWDREAEVDVDEEEEGEVHAELVDGGVVLEPVLLVLLLVLAEQVADDRVLDLQVLGGEFVDAAHLVDDAVQHDQQDQDREDHDQVGRELRCVLGVLDEVEVLLHHHLVEEEDVEEQHQQAGEVLRVVVAAGLDQLRDRGDLGLEDLVVLLPHVRVVHFLGVKGEGLPGAAWG